MSKLTESFSGVRGVYGEDIDEEFSKRYAFAFYTLLKNKIGKEPKIVVGMDTRESGDAIKQALISVLTDVVDLDIATTPMIELGVREYNADGGIIITASHNPPEYNGFKFLGSDGAVLRPEMMEELIELRRNVVAEEQEAKIQDKHDEIVEKYIEFIFKIVGDVEKIKNSGFKIVVDPNGGAAVVVIEELLRRLGVEVVGVNMEKAEFNRNIDPNNESLSYLVDKIKQEGADFGIGFDCDADRAEIMLEDGEIVSGNHLFGILLDKMGENNKTVVMNDVVSGSVKEIAKKHGMRVEEVEVGEINVVDKMEKTGAILGGESSGVVVPPSTCRDGLLVFVMVLKILSEKGKKLGEVLDELPKYYSIQEKMKTDDALRTREKLKRFFSEKYKITEKGGETGSLKIIVDGSFLWFRASKTEAGVFRIISDSNNKEKAEQLLKEGIEAFENA
ncbi:hypothetical protein HQ529_04195 [Candidatus Woesearchaeota archaeon]|nr:hypothetical protein [Candidatus Woesearchaeota archaeon]